MRRFNPSAPPRLAIEKDLVVQDPARSLHASLAARADLEPGSQQLLVGGIGSGKTTELLLAERRLKEQGKSIVFYVDITAETNVSDVGSGAVMASVALRLLKIVEGRSNEISSKDLSELARRIKAFAFGETKWEEAPPDEWYMDDDGETEPSEGEDEVPLVPVKIQGKLKRPFPPLKRDIKEILPHIERLVETVKKSSHDLIVILDGLDRLLAPEKFWAVAQQDFQALRKVAVSLLASAPLAILYGGGRQVADYFDHVRHLPTAVADPKESSFLMKILERRGAGDLLERRLMQTLCLSSGGVVRDLISLTRNACENAYITANDRIQEAHVIDAVTQLGRAYYLGLGKRQLHRLRLWHRAQPSFDESADIDLLVTRRLLEYEGPPPRYDVHPSLERVLAKPDE